MSRSRVSRMAGPPALLIALLLGGWRLALSDATAATPPPAQAAAAARKTDPAGATQAPHAEKSVRFAILGDTGTGGSAQFEIGERLAASRTVFPFDFVLMLGDNIYGSERPQDFIRKFELPYKALHDQKIPFYASLGNHDDPNQRFYKPFNMNGERYYTFEKDGVRFFALDSNYMDQTQQAWLEKELSASRNTWKIAFFHHPLYSSGARHGSEVDLRAVLEPIFLKYGVSVVFSGHEHFYERLKPQKGITYFTNGGAAKLREGNIRVGSAMTAKGYDTDRSYMLAEIDGKTLYFQTLSRAGALIDSGSVTAVTPPAAVSEAAPRSPLEP
jgi:3',5'-cyclic AMP phosphodiesterase CpdA